MPDELTRASRDWCTWSLRAGFRATSRKHQQLLCDGKTCGGQYTIKQGPVVIHR